MSREDYPDGRQVAKIEFARTIIVAACLESVRGGPITREEFDAEVDKLIAADARIRGNRSETDWVSWSDVRLMLEATIRQAQEILGRDKP